MPARSADRASARRPSGSRVDERRAAGPSSRSAGQDREPGAGRVPAREHERAVDRGALGVDELHRPPGLLAARVGRVAGPQRRVHQRRHQLPPSPAAIQVVPSGVSTVSMRHGSPTQVASDVEARRSPVSTSRPSSDVVPGSAGRSWQAASARAAMSAVATSGGIRRRIVGEAAIPPEVCHRHRTSSRQDQVADPSPSANVDGDGQASTTRTPARRRRSGRRRSRPGSSRPGSSRRRVPVARSSRTRPDRRRR